MFRFLIIILLFSSQFTQSQETDTSNNNQAKIDLNKAKELIVQLGANHFKVRKKAKIELSKMGYQVLPILKEHLAKSDDPEVSENIKEIIAKLSYRLHINQLSDVQRKIAKLEFKQGPIQTSSVECEYYKKFDHLIIDIGISRVVIPGDIKELNENYRKSINMIVDGNSSGGGSSSSNGFKIYQYSYENGVGYWTICGHSFTVSSFILEIKNKKLNLKPDQPQILFFDKDLKPVGILDVK